MPAISQIKIHFVGLFTFSFRLNLDRVCHRDERGGNGLGQRLAGFFGQGGCGVRVGAAFRPVKQFLDLPRLVILFFGDSGIHFGKRGRKRIDGKILREIHAGGELRGGIITRLIAPRHGIILRGAAGDNQFKPVQIRR